MDWRKTLETLRSQFAAAAGKWLLLRHALQGDSPINLGTLFKDATQPIDGSPRLYIEYDCHSDSVMYEDTVVSHHYRCGHKSQDEDKQSLDAFKSLAQSAETVILQLPPEGLALLRTPEDADPDLGVGNRLWLDQWWQVISHDHQSKAREAAVAAGDVPSSVYVPDADELHWLGRPTSPGLRWARLLHNLGWRVDCGHPLHAKREIVLSVKKRSEAIRIVIDDSRPIRESIESGRRLGAELDVPLPLGSIRSKLPSSPFTCSVWAIDMLLDTAGKEHVPADDYCLTVTDVSKLLGKHTGQISRWCDDGRLVNNGKRGGERLISQASAIEMQKQLLDGGKIYVAKSLRLH